MLQCGFSFCFYLFTFGKRTSDAETTIYSRRFGCWMNLERICVLVFSVSPVFRCFGVSPSMTVDGSFRGRPRGFRGINKLCTFFRCRSRSYFRVNSRSHSGHFVSFSILGIVWLWAVSKCLFRTALLRKTMSHTGHFEELLPKLIPCV